MGANRAPHVRERETLSQKVARTNEAAQSLRGRRSRVRCHDGRPEEHPEDLNIKERLVDTKEVLNRAREALRNTLTH